MKIIDGRKWYMQGDLALIIGRTIGSTGNMVKEGRIEPVKRIKQKIDEEAKTSGTKRGPKLSAKRTHASRSLSRSLAAA